MGLVLATDVEDDVPVGVPLIGWHNIVTAANIDSTTEATGFPITNAANPATHLKWKGGVNTGSEIITITTNTTDEIDYVGVVGHNWGTLACAITVSGIGISAPTSLLHFESGDSPAAFVDSASTPHVWLPAGNATISAADFKFGAASGLFDGTGDYLQGDGSSDFAFGTGDFTIDFWIKLNATGTPNLYDSRPAATNGAYPTITITTGTVLRYFTNTATQITGTTSLTTGIWYHVALTRGSGNTRLFLNGVQEGSTYVDATNYIVGANRPIVCADGNSLGSFAFNGRMDDLRIIKGAAAWITEFDVPSSAHVATTTNISTTLTNDDPVIFRFEPRSTATVTITLAVSGSEPPEAAVIYVGSLLVLERSITIGRGHVPITYGRRSNIVNGMSETGNFLGRIVLGEHRESKAEFEWFTPDFYRSDIDEFLAAAQENPFFWAWSPDEYPDEVGYVWLVNNAEPEVDPVTRRIALELQMRGIA